jgi:hypothetical protein
MDKKNILVAEKLLVWQGNAQSQMATDSEVKVFNLIGNIVNLVRGDIMEIKNAYEFIGDYTTLSKEEKRKAGVVIANAESITRDELKNEETDKDE